MQEAIYSVTFVMGKPPMITVRADDATGWKINLKDAAESGALTEIKQINDSLNGVRSELQPGPAVQVPSPDGRGTVTIQDGQVVSQPAQELPGGFANPSCVECGGATRFDKEGVSQKSGKPYKRYICTANSTHKATFTN